MGEELRREIGLGGAIMMGLGSIIGTGVFVSLAIAAGVAGNAVLPAIVVAALVATCNGLSSAQLAANHPKSGGTYEYGYRYLDHRFGFTAGWMFLLAKSASAATAALGVAAYTLRAVGALTNTLMLPLALAVVALVAVVILGGIRRSNFINTIIVSLSLATLVFFVAAGLGSAVVRGWHQVTPGSASSLPAFFEATALVFVAYTGYGRIATLGEEVREPRRIIPRAMIVTLGLAMAIYVLVALTSIATVGVDAYAATVHQDGAPLESVARGFGVGGAGRIMAIGAIVAMLGVLLNLLLGLSRVLLAMGRRGDMPAAVARIHATSGSPRIAIAAVTFVVALIVLLRDIRLAWSFSAFTVLVYYAITNLAAWGLSDAERLYPRWIAGTGVVSCLFLAFWVEPWIMAVGLGLIGLGLIWHGVARRLQGTMHN